MRIAAVEFAGRGGLIHYSYQLCRALAAQDTDVTLLTDRGYELATLPHPFEVVRLFDLWDPKPEDPESRSGPLRRVWRGVLHYRAWWRLVGHVRQNRPDAVLLGDVRFASDLVPVRRLSRTGSALVEICHNVHPFALRGRAAGLFRRGGVTRAIYERIHRTFDAVFVHYASNRRRFLDTYGVAPRRVHAIPLGDASLFRRLRDPGVDAVTLRRRLDLSEDSPVVLFFGSLSRYKGLDLLLDAFREVVSEHPSARLVVAGYPLPDLSVEEIRRLAESLGIGAWMRLVPRYVPSEELGAWMELAAVAAFPYRAISQSAALQTALTYGVPSVVTAVGALPEMVVGGEAGLVVPPGDTASLAAAISSLLADPATARTLGERGRIEAETTGDWERIAAGVLEVLRGLG